MGKKIKIEELKALCNDTESGFLFISLIDQTFYKVKAFLNRITNRGRQITPVNLTSPLNSTFFSIESPVFRSDYVEFKKGDTKSLKPESVNLGEYEIVQSSGTNPLAEEGVAGDFNADASFLEVRVELWDGDHKKYENIRKNWKDRMYDEMFAALIMGSVGLLTPISLGAWIYRYGIINILDLLDSDDFLGAGGITIPLTTDGTQNEKDFRFKADKDGADYDVSCKIRFF